MSKNNRITYFYRNIKVGFSINKVFHTITTQISGKEEFEVPCYRAQPIDIIRNIIFVWRHRNKRGINHITGDIHYCVLALIGCKTVLTIHDTSPYDHAKSAIKRCLIYYLWFYFPLRLATRIVCISECTKKSVERFTKRKDIVVIYNPIDPVFKEHSQRFNESEPNILLIGTAWNKNIPRIIKATAGINCILSIIGELSSELKKELEVTGAKYIVKSNLTDEEVYDEYCKCDIVCFCSLFEGFGMPIIEANKTGKVVVCSNISPLKEVASDAALMVNPYSVPEIRNALLRVIGDSKLRGTLILKGKKNIRRFDQTLIAESYRFLYENI